jgi:GNAT superfamily N-acetyltransferase
MEPGSSSGNAVIAVLRSEDAAAWDALIFPSMREHLRELSANGPHVAFGATVDGCPSGLVYGEKASDGIGYVRCLFVRATERNRGFATALLESIENQFRALGCSAAKIAWITGKPSTTPLERVLARRGWSQPSMQQLICKTDERVLEWYCTKQEWLFEPFTLFLWSELTPEDRETIERTQADSHWIPEDLVPFQYEKDFEPLNSLGLRFHGEPVGWMITHRVAPHTIRYTCSFIRTDLQGRFRIAPIYREAILRQTRAGVPNVIFMVPAQHRAMVAFVKRHWGGKFADLTESRESSKQLREVPLANS